MSRRRGTAGGVTKARRRAISRAGMVAALVLALSSAAGGGCIPYLRQGAPPAGTDGTVASSTQTTPTQAMPLAGKVAPPPTGAYLGVFAPPAPFDQTALSAYESLVGKPVSIVMWYQQWGPRTQQEFDPAACVAVWRRGKVPMISWEPWDPAAGSAGRGKANQPAFRLTAIINGKYDTYIRGWAHDIRLLGGPIMLRPMHEMNGFWYPWGGTVNGNTPAQYRAAWRHIHDIFVQEGATNVTWVWSINHNNVPSTAQNSYAAYYPGDAYVDWTGISGFNWGTSNPGSKWVMFTRVYADPVAYLSRLNKPICLTEIGSVEQGGDKGAWLADAFSRMQSEPAVRGVIYYDNIGRQSNRTQDWRIDSSAASLAAFKKAVAPPYYVGAPPAALSTWASSLSAAQWTYLTSLAPVY